MWGKGADWGPYGMGGKGGDAWGGGDPNSGMAGGDAWAGMGGGDPYAGMGGGDPYAGMGVVPGWMQGGASAYSTAGFGAWGMKGGKSKKGPPKPAVEWVAKPKHAMPDIVMIELPPDSKLLATGICQNPIPVIEHEKLDVFSEAHYFVQNLVGDVDVRSMVELEHENFDSQYSDFHATWKAAGHEENIPTLAKCASAQRCAIGMGGKKNAERAAKLAMSLVLAQVLDPAKVAEVCTNYPTFKKFLEHAGVDPGC